MAAGSESSGLGGFAESAVLEPGTGGELPRTGSLLSRSGLQVQGAVHGRLAGDRPGILCHLTYTTTSDDTTTTHRKTAAVLRVPESIGYAPFLQVGSGFGVTTSAFGGFKISEPAPGVRLVAAEGIDEGWLMELFSPALGEWLGRSPKDFGAELADGVLVVIRDSHLTEERKLIELCADAAKIAEAIREESVEESEAGGGTVAKRAPSGPNEIIAAGLIPKLGRPDPPAHVGSVLGDAQRLATRSGAVVGSTVRGTVLIMLAVNVIGGGIYGLLLTVGDPLTNVFVYQIILFAVIGSLRFRSVTAGVAKVTAEEAFFQGYARSRGLREVEPLRFAGEHAEAGLPGTPVRVLEGLFGGVPGFLMLTGDGRERGHRIALVRGAKGPTATTELNVSAPGISAAALDEYTATLLLDLETQPVEAGA